MNILIPVAMNYGLDSAVYGHFGSAPFFLLVDETGSILEEIDNRSGTHLHGQCRPLDHVAGRSVDAIIAGGIGLRALSSLLAAGIRVYSSNDGTVEDALQQFKLGKLQAMSELESCSGHGHSGGCH